MAKAGTRSRQDMLLDVARRMPPLRHKLPGETFARKNSEAAQWLLEQPKIIHYVWERVCSRSEDRRLVKYDAETGRWRGVDYDGD